MISMHSIVRRHLSLAALTLGAAGLAGALVFSQQAPPATLAIDPARYLEHVKVLASDELGGRGNGTPGLDRAAEYIARQFDAVGLEPYGDPRSYFQPFEIATALRIDPGNALAIAGPAGSATLQLGREYAPLSVTASTTTSAPEKLPLVFAGYGIVAPDLHYDDYAGIDIKDKAALLFTHEPQESLESSVFSGRAQTRHATVMSKAMQARTRGARLIVLVEDPLHATDSGRYEAFLKDPQADEYGIPVVRVRREALEPLLNGVIDLKEIHRAIDGDASPRSQVLPHVSVTFTERYTKIRSGVRNVVGYLPGADPARASEAIVIGAHYDHLGLGGRLSLAPESAGQIHNGADDNASGTAALIEMARAAASRRERFPRSLVFVAFAGEELGLLGSAYYVNHPVVPLDRTVAMLNLDMIGRPDGRILVDGIDTAPALDGDLKAVQSIVGLDVKTFRTGAAVGASDDTSFAIRQIPAISFFSGFHGDYHRPTDDWEKIDSAGGARVATLALELAQRIAARSQRVAFVPRNVPTATTPAGAAGAGGYGPYFGSVPDFADEGNGLRFADIREGSPAGQAGLRRGDVLIRFDGMAIKTVYDFTFALREKRPGDKVEVVVLRDGKELTVTVELGNRP